MRAPMGTHCCGEKTPPFWEKKGYHAHGDHMAALKALTCHCLTDIQPLVKVLAPVDHLLDTHQKTSLNIFCCC